ncbi:MAG: hypothetical protein ACFFDV_06735 [Candidatus Thorarchaeota archaeon]
MEIKHYKSIVTNPRRFVNPIDVIQENCKTLNKVIQYLSQLKPQRASDYAIALENRLRTDIRDYQIDYSLLNIHNKLKECEFLNRYPDLLDAMICFALSELQLPTTYELGSGEVDVPLMSWLRALNVFRYHRVKAIVDIMGRNEGIELWKDLVYRATQESLKGSTEERHPPIKEIAEGWIKEGETGESCFELTVVSFDDYKVALKFDQCPVFDSVKHLEDREIAYLSYCWTGQPEQELSKKTRRKKTPQTLYQSDYCVEFFWDDNVHPNAETPSNDFWHNLPIEK